MEFKSKSGKVLETIQKMESLNKIIEDKKEHNPKGMKKNIKFKNKKFNKKQNSKKKNYISPFLVVVGDPFRFGFILPER